MRPSCAIESNLQTVTHYKHIVSKLKFGVDIVISVCELHVASGACAIVENDKSVLYQNAVARFSRR